MEKNRIQPIKSGTGMRISYARQDDVLEVPNLIEIQKDSYDWFLREGLAEVFEDISPIEDYSDQLSLEFVDYQLCKDDVKYSIEECKERDATYAAPLKVKVRLHNKETDEIKQHEIFMGDLPLMTATGTFIINGAERVIVSQLVRSPGIYYGIAHDKIGKELYSSTVIPNRGAWLEYETDSNDVFNVRVDRTRKVPITVLIRALGIGTNAEIKELFGEEPKILASIEKDPSDNYEDGLLELYKKIRPGEPLSVDSAESLINSMFFDPRRYDLAKVGRYKFNKKLALRNRISGFILAEDVLDPTTGEVLAEAGTNVDMELADKIQNAAVASVMIQTEEGATKVLSNMEVNLAEYVDFNPEEIGVHEDVFYPVLEKILEEGYEGEELKEALKKNIHELIPKHITKEDIIEEAKTFDSIPVDVVEWRADWFEGVFDFAKVEDVLKDLRTVLGNIPLLMTFRTSKEGGEKAIEPDAYAELNIKAAQTGYVDLVDVEIFTGDDIVKKIIDGAHAAGVKVIASNHDFFKTPAKADIIYRLRKMQDMNADIPKIAVMPQNKKDVLTLLAATEEMTTNYADRPIITMSMAGTGLISRLCGEVFGSALTFGAAKKASAPGQAAVNDLNNMLQFLHENQGL